MALKKSELYSSLWSSCDELRGSMDASQYKDMVALKGKADIGDQVNKKVLGPLAKENNLSDMPDFADATKLGTGKELVDRLTNLIAIFENKALDFSKNRADGDDILGDAYEYLMRHFATERGKSKGQFYTPAEVSRIMAQIIGIRGAGATNATTVYDPTCGSGSLLLKVGDEASARVTLYGQEKDAATTALARMNMILHNNPTALIKQGNTLANLLFTSEDGQLKTFDYVVANPPFSDKRWSTPGCHPKALIAALSEDLLAHYTDKPLIDKYDVYQHLMDYWAETMLDDCYLVATDGWKAETARVLVKNNKGKEVGNGWTCDLVPKTLIVARYVAKEHEAITKLEAELESLTAQLTELEEEHGGEEGAFAPLDKVNKTNVTARLKELGGLFQSDADAKEEAEVLDAWLKLSNQEADRKRALRDAEFELDTLAYAKYPTLTEAEIQALVVDDKWLATLAAAIHGEMDRISQALTQRVKELAERYETPMPQQVRKVAELEEAVNRHLTRMGFAA